MRTNPETTRKETTQAIALPMTEDRNPAVRALVREGALVGAGTLLIALCANISVPFWPAPFTMQTFAVVLIGACFGFQRATTTVLTYLAAGAVGLPVFASAAGGAAFVGPTSGYLLGFVAAAALTGALMECGFARHWALTTLAMVIGTAAILYGGTAWLAIGWGFGWEQSTLMQLPYLPGAAAKILLAMAVLPYARRATQRWLSR
ncbi:MAG: biotin transporter BioY [Planctomycetota bacterium]